MGARDLSESQALTKIHDAFRQFPDTRGNGSANGKLDQWLSKLYKNKDFRQEVKTKNNNSLAQYVCEQVERTSKAAGEPWTRRPPKPKAKAQKPIHLTFPPAFYFSFRLRIF